AAGALGVAFACVSAAKGTQFRLAGVHAGPADAAIVPRGVARRRPGGMACPDGGHPADRRNPVAIAAAAPATAIPSAHALDLGSGTASHRARLQCRIAIT